MTDIFRPHQFALEIAGGWRSATTRPLVQDLLARTLYDNAAQRGGCRRYPLDNYTETKRRDRAAQDDAAGKVPALGPGWQWGAIDNHPADWQQHVSAKEAQLISAAAALYTAELAILNAVATPSDVQKERIAALEDLLAELADGNGLEQVPSNQLFPQSGSATAVYKRLSAPNVPFHYTARVTLQMGRPFTLWLYRAKPRPGQVNHALQIEVSTKIRLLLEGENQATVYRKNDSRDPVEWAAKDAERDALLAKKYISVAQSDAIRVQREAIAQIKADAKGKKKTPAQEKDIKDRNAQIQAIQKAHGLTPAEKARLEELEDSLFYDVQRLDLSETADSLVGTPFALTLIDSGVGHILFNLDIGSNTYVFEDKHTTGRHVTDWLWGTHSAKTAPGYNSAERLEIKGTGGACAWRFGYVAVDDNALLLSQPMNLGRVVDLDDITLSGQWTNVLPPNAIAAGVDVRFLLIEAPDKPAGWYQMGLRFLTGPETLPNGTRTPGRWLPLAFRASATLLPAPRPPSVLEWDSRNRPGVLVQAAPRLSENRGVMWSVTLSAPTAGGPASEVLGLPANLKERVVTLWRRQGADEEWQAVLTEGLISNESADFQNAGAAPETYPWSEVTLTLEDKRRPAAAARFDYAASFDNMFLGDAAAEAFRNEGYADWELADIPTGAGSPDNPMPRLPQADPGSKAAVHPSKGANVLPYVEQELIGKHGLGLGLWVNRAGAFQLTRPGARLLREKDGTPVAYHLASETGNPRRIYFEDEQHKIVKQSNVEKYFTAFEVVGGINPATKQPFVARRSVPEATNEALAGIDPRYLGYDRPMDPVNDASLNSQDACDRVADTLKIKHGHPRDTITVKAQYSPDLLPGDQFFLGGALWQLTNAPSVQTVDDEMVLELATPEA